jgi:hypothetical protein
MWPLVQVPFAAADEVASDYLLSSFAHNPHTGELSLAHSSVPALPLYFDKGVFMGGPAAPLEFPIPSSRNLAPLQHPSTTMPPPPVLHSRLEPGSL